MSRGGKGLGAPQAPHDGSDAARIYHQRDAYAPCTCGSGKKYKWCCRAKHVREGRAKRGLVKDG